MKHAIAPFVAFTLIASFVSAAPAGNPVEQGQKTVDKALTFLKKQQQENGSWQRGEREPPAITALVLRALIQEKKPTEETEAAKKKAIAYILSQQQEDGSIQKGMLANYNTAICISALTAVKDPALKGPIDKAVAYLKANQFNDTITGADGKKIDESNPFFGGWGYGGTKGRPDVSNAGIVIEALKDAGLAENDPAYKNAVTFLSRLQNHSETNKAPWASEDGGFVYSTGKTGDGESSAGEFTTPDGKRQLRSYGSMTYAGLKSMLYAGLKKDDSRVKAAFDWISKNWSVKENPGMGAANPENAKSGIFYYYHTLARSLDVYDAPKLTDVKGESHDWRAELIAELSTIQKEDGSYIGDRKWMEDNQVIATVLATLALQDALKDIEQHAAAK